MTSGLLRDGVPEPNPGPPRSPFACERHFGDHRVPYDPLGNPDWRMEGREMEGREEGAELPWPHERELRNGIVSVVRTPFLNGHVETG
jgi:hypothetical protein